MRIPATARVFFEVAQLVVGEETSPVRRVGKIRVVRRHHVDPQEKSIGQFGENFARMFETRRPPGYRNDESGGQPAKNIPRPSFEIAIFVHAASKP